MDPTSDPAATTLYADLGVRPDATAEDLRRAYRSLARRLHPDVNEEMGSDERMRRVNHAWAVLGDPTTRAAYDRNLRQPEPPRPLHGAPNHGPLLAPDPAPTLRWLRPSMIVVVILTIIFIATAYVGPHQGNAPPVTTGATIRGTPSTEPLSGLVASNLVGKCLLGLSGYDAIVPCFEHNDGLVVGQTAHSADCPVGTVVHQLAGRSQFVCLAGKTP